ncbi:MAG: type I glyceraldehyde-3-phosphate dehydrogenase [Desulfobulbaceae bacterium DB1]|nr:MAG: type I glyceraldehyde-3-phosphate dehydrogenase [Desulfobulbaceae bacterium DB1]
MAHHVAINGYGRIGRAILRAYYRSNLRDKIRIKAINDISPIEQIAYLTKYDTTYGRFPEAVTHGEHQLQINGDVIPVTGFREISKLRWADHGIDIVLECSGCHAKRASLQSHIDRGAEKVVLSCPGGDDLDATIVYGVNDHLLTNDHKIISNASCTTNCIVPVIKVLDDAFGIDHGMITTIHSMMNDQPVIDAYHQCHDLRRTRSGVQSMVPVATELARGVGRILPHLAGRFQSASMRVPTTNVSVIDLTVGVLRGVDSHAVNEAFKDGASGSLQGVLGYTEEPLVSCDFNQDSRSAVIDGSQTRVSGSRMVRVLAWFDNEWGYANRMLDTTLKFLNV